MARRWRRTLARFALLVLWNLVLSFLLAEGLLRLVPGLGCSQVPLIREMSLELHHELKPSVAGVELDWGPRRVTYATNSLAMRDRGPRRVALDDGRRRVLVLGDSFVEGIGVEYDDTFVARLETRLRQDDPTTEVLDAGVSSYAPILEYLRLRQLLAQGLRPETVLVFLDPGDPMDDIGYVEDFATFDHAGEPVDMSRTDPYRGETLLATLWRRLNGSSLVVFNLEELLRGKRASAEPRPHPTGYTYQPGPRWTGREQERGAWTRGGREWELWGERGVELVRKDLVRMKRLADQVPSRLVVVVYPHPVQLRDQYQGRFLSRTWEGVIGAEGLPLVDLTPCFAGRPDWRACFIPGDQHWNEEGHRFVAELLYQRVFVGR